MDRVGRSSRHLVPVDDTEFEPAVAEPTVAELAAIEAEMPLILAEVGIVEAEVAMAIAPHNSLAWRQHRRTVRRALTLAAASGTSVEVA